MTRVKRGTIAHKKREKILKATKGFMWGRKSKEKLAKEALVHAYQNAFRGRKEKKRDYRSLWIVRMNAALREEGISYSKFIASVKKADIKLDRRVLSDIAANRPEAWKEVVAVGRP
ncbi:MAG: 50S ribosomal protein L20 [Candidatus Colwellbacteria bacterium]|nr:50S ribosomal protein L20 [Candidatus Colwellbacteria bacterium]